MTYLTTNLLLLNKPFPDDFMVEEFRAGEHRKTSKPSVHLNDLLELCRERQDWFVEIAISEGCEELPFVGSASLDSDPVEVARKIRETIKFDLCDRKHSLPENRYLRTLVDKVEEAEILVMISSQVGTNVRRQLDVNEFRGFALYDKIAPLIFVNGADHTPSQIFTLCHELAHIWLGESAFVKAPLGSIPKRKTEAFCNKVAWEILVPAQDLAAMCSGKEGNIEKFLKRLKRRYRVSNMTLLLRLKSVGEITDPTFARIYKLEMEKLQKKSRKGGSGNFYPSLIKANGRRFVYNLVADTISGDTLYTEALDLLGAQHTKVIDGLAAEMGIQ